jgi:hypothetical protein
LLAALVAAASPAARGQALATVDTEMTALGIVQLHGDAADSAAAWVVFLPTPVRLGSLRTNVLELEDPRAAQRYVDRFVEVRGRVTIGRDGGAAYHAVVSGARLREVRPPGTVERAVDLSLSQHATVLLSLVPRQVTWHDSAGKATATTPTVLFSVVNHSLTPLEFSFPSDEVVCISVRPAEGGAGREMTWRVRSLQDLVVLRMGAVFRQIVAVPDSAAATPGRYTVRAALCGADEFHAETELRVVAP